MQGLSKRTSKAKSSWWFQDSVFSGYMMCRMLPNNALYPSRSHPAPLVWDWYSKIFVDQLLEGSKGALSITSHHFVEPGLCYAMLLRLGTILAIPPLLPYPGPLGDPHHRGPVAEQYPAAATTFRATSASLLARNKWIYVLYLIVIHLWGKKGSNNK